MKVRTARKKQVAFLYLWSQEKQDHLERRGIILNVADSLTPAEGGWIAFNREYPDDRWYLTPDYVDHFYEFVGELDWDEPEVHADDCAMDEDCACGEQATEH